MIVSYQISNHWIEFTNWVETASLNYSFVDLSILIISLQLLKFPSTGFHYWFGHTRIRMVFHTAVDHLQSLCHLQELINWATSINLSVSYHWLNLYNRIYFFTIQTSFKSLKLHWIISLRSVSFQLIDSVILIIPIPKPVKAKWSFCIVGLTGLKHSPKRRSSNSKWWIKSVNVPIGFRRRGRRHSSNARWRWTRWKLKDSAHWKKWPSRRLS